MKKIYSVPTDVQLIKIADILSEELSDIKKENMSIIFELNNELLKQVDEDYFYKNNPEAEINNLEPVSEVNIIISGIKFKFITREDEKEA